MSYAIVKINHQPSGGKEWVAEIIGRHPKYKFELNFLNPVEKDWSSTGKTGTTGFELKEGKMYQVNEPFQGRYFLKVENGETKPATTEEVLAYADMMENLKNQKKTTLQITDPESLLETLTHYKSYLTASLNAPQQNALDEIIQQLEDQNQCG